MVTGSLYKYSETERSVVFFSEEEITALGAASSVGLAAMCLWVVEASAGLTEGLWY